MPEKRKSELNRQLGIFARRCRAILSLHSNLQSQAKSAEQSGNNFLEAVTKGENNVDRVEQSTILTFDISSIPGTVLPAAWTVGYEELSAIPDAISVSLRFIDLSAIDLDIPAHLGRIFHEDWGLGYTALLIKEGQDHTTRLPAKLKAILNGDSKPRIPVFLLGDKISHLQNAVPKPLAIHDQSLLTFAKAAILYPQLNRYLESTDLKSESVRDQLLAVFQEVLCSKP